MALKPWYNIIVPREDLRENKPLDAAEFAVHLDQVRDGSAPTVYKDPNQFFQRTYLTQNLTALGAEAIRRLSGEQSETSAIFNLTTQFGGGKTHALALLYHLAHHGPAADSWPGVAKLLERANISSVPKAQTAIFVGTEFDSISGRGGQNGTPVRKTPWGEIAYQLGGEAGLEIVAEHERQMIAPAGDVIRQILPKHQPCLILMDELMNYASRNRRSGLSAQLYNFLQNLSEVARGRTNVVLAVSIPASELEMTADDQSDYERFKKLLDRLGKAVIMSAESETSEIIRRRLFDWSGSGVTANGKVQLSSEAIRTCQEYADWVIDHRQQLPGSFGTDNVLEAFAATYPFHPTVLSVFERKWQTLPRFQQTRGVLRLLALWVAQAYQKGFGESQREPLISLGTAPLDSQNFRAAVFEQLGESRLEGAVTADIAGKAESHATRLDREADDSIRKARLHRKVATSIFFESNGGTLQNYTTLPEIRLAVGGPDMDVANVETVLDALVPPDGACYYLDTTKNRYWFSQKPNLNKLLSDRRASIKDIDIEERVRSEIEKTFTTTSGIQLIYFPEKSNNIADRPVLTLAVLSPEYTLQDDRSLPLIESLTREAGNSLRTFKSAIIWCVADSDGQLRDEARKALAWARIQDEDNERLDDTQRRQLQENFNKTKGNLREAVWRSYKNLVMLDKNNQLRVVDLGMVHSSASDTLVNLILNRLRQDGDVEKDIVPGFLVRNWPPAFKEWPVRAVRDAFFASPQFPRLLNHAAIQDTIARGVASGVIALVSKKLNGSYDPFYYRQTISPSEAEFQDDVFIITGEVAGQYLQRLHQEELLKQSQTTDASQIREQEFPYGQSTTTGDPIDSETVPNASVIDSEVAPDALTSTTPELTQLTWQGQIPTQKWMNFYTRVLSKYANSKDLRLTIRVEVTPEGGLSPQKLNETRVALRELGLNDDLEVK